MSKRLLLILAGLLVGFPIYCFGAENWTIKKSSHFIIYYKKAPDDFIDNVIDTAEEYYRDITGDLGFTRYGSWSWEDRCKIYIHDDSDEYMKATNQPGWSGGAVSYREKIINTYPLAAGFFDTLLPHELGHIIFREFVGYKARLPLWMDEGVACYLEKARRWGANRIVREAIKEKTFIPLEKLSGSALAYTSDRKMVEIFYAEAGSVIYYLITKFGKYKFVDFCRALKEGDSFEVALRSTYSRFDNVEDLGKAWMNYLENEE